MNKNYFLVGYSGHSYVLLDSCLNQNILIKGYFDIKECTKNPYELIFLGLEESFPFNTDDHIIIGIGNNTLRKNVFSKFKSLDCNLKTIIDPSSKISNRAKIEIGSFIGPKAVLNSQVNIGIGTIVNTGAIIEHECNVGQFSHIAPGSILCGNVTVGSSTFIGAGSVIKEGICIGNNVTVGAGSIVLKDIPDGETWIGHPAKRMSNS